MSRGMGRIERRALRILEQERRLIETFELAARVYGIEPDEHGVTAVTENALSSARRALTSLAKKELVCGIGGYRDHRIRWCLLELAATQARGDREAFDFLVHNTEHAKFPLLAAMMRDHQSGAPRPSGVEFDKSNLADFSTARYADVSVGLVRKIRKKMRRPSA